MHLWASCGGGCKEGGRGARSRRLRRGHPGPGAAALSRPGCSNAARMHIQAATVPRRSRCATGRIIRFRYVLSQPASQPAGAAPGVSRTARTCPWPPGCGWGCRYPADRTAKRRPQARLQEQERDGCALCQLSPLPPASMRGPNRARLRCRRLLCTLRQLHQPASSSHTSCCPPMHCIAPWLSPACPSRPWSDPCTRTGGRCGK